MGELLAEPEMAEKLVKVLAEARGLIMSGLCSIPYTCLFDDHSELVLRRLRCLLDGIWSLTSDRRNYERVQTALLSARSFASLHPKGLPSGPKCNLEPGIVVRKVSPAGWGGLPPEYYPSSLAKGVRAARSCHGAGVTSEGRWSERTTAVTVIATATRMRVSRLLQSRESLLKRLIDEEIRLRVEQIGN